MSSSSDPFAGKPVPDYLKAITELTSEAQHTNTRRYLRDYGKVILFLIGYGFVAWSAPNNSVGISFFGAMLIVFMLHELSERRAQRRLRLIHEVLIQLVRRTDKTD